MTHNALVDEVNAIMQGQWRDDGWTERLRDVLARGVMNGVITKKEELAVWLSMVRAISAPRDFDDRSYDEMLRAGAEVEVPFMGGNEKHYLRFPGGLTVRNHRTYGAMIAVSDEGVVSGLLVADRLPVDVFGISWPEDGATVVSMRPDWMWDSQKTGGLSGVQQWLATFTEMFLKAVQNPVTEEVEAPEAWEGQPKEGAPAVPEQAPSKPPPYRFVKKVYAPRVHPVHPGTPKANHAVRSHQRRYRSGLVVTVREHRAGRRVSFHA